MRERVHKIAIKAFAIALAMVACFAAAPKANALPSIYDHMMPLSVNHMTATGRTVSANQAELSKISPEFGDAYRLHEASYTFNAPDKLEYHTQVGPTSVSLITTNDYRLVKVRAGIIKKDDKTDITKDVTKRQTLFSLGLLPKNYLDTVRSDYEGRETVQGINCQVFTLRYITDAPNSNRRFRVWVDPTKHYVVQKRVWNGDNEQRETIVYLNPMKVIGDVWLPQRAECYNPEGHLAGVVEYVNVSAS